MNNERTLEEQWPGIEQCTLPIDTFIDETQRHAAFDEVFAKHNPQMVRRHPGKYTSIEGLLRILKKKGFDTLNVKTLKTQEMITLLRGSIPEERQRRILISSIDLIAMTLAQEYIAIHRSDSEDTPKALPEGSLLQKINIESEEIQQQMSDKGYAMPLHALTITESRQAFNIAGEINTLICNLLFTE
jgi:hypothetical protein